MVLEDVVRFGEQIKDIKDPRIRRGFIDSFKRMFEFNRSSFNRYPY